MALALCNAQSELSPIERGMHALHSGMDVKAYAVSVGRARSSVHNEVYAAEVAESVPHVGNGLTDYFRHLTEIHAAPRWLWPALFAALVAPRQYSAFGPYLSYVPLSATIMTASIPRR